MNLVSSKGKICSSLLLFFSLWGCQYDSSEAQAPLNEDPVELFATLSDRGAVSIQREYADLIEIKPVAWANDWRWDGPVPNKELVTKPTSLPASTSVIHYRKLKVDSTVSTTIVAPNKLRLDISLEFNQSIEEFIGLGLQIQFNEFLVEPKQLMKTANADKGELFWKYDTNKSASIQFEPSQISSIKKLSQKNGLFRLFFAEGKIASASRRNISLHVAFDDNVVIAAKPPTPSTDWKISRSESLIADLDLAYLNHKPAGRFGFVRANGANFEFSNGERIRFYGTNIQAKTLFIKDKKLIEEHARRLASLGFNLVRLHHHDAKWADQGLVKTFDEEERYRERLDSYFWWIKCLKEQGIYIWVDLQSSREWRPQDGLDGWSSDLAGARGTKKFNRAKGFIYLNSTMRTRTREFNERLLLATNPYTKLALVNEPAVMGVLLTNENDLTNHYAHKLAQQDRFPFHHELFKQSAEEYSKALNSRTNTLLQPWRPNKPKIFLNFLESDFNFEMIQHLRSIGLKVPIATTNNWGKTQIISLPALATGSMIDAHGYAKTHAISSHPLHKDNYIHRLATSMSFDKPFTVSEYNAEADRIIVDSHFIPIYTSAVASHQEWDAIMLYGYSQDSFKQKKLSAWSSHNNPVILRAAQVGALLYRQSFIKASNDPKVLSLTREEFFDKNYSSTTHQQFRLPFEQSRIAINHPKIAPSYDSDLLSLTSPAKLTTENVIHLSDLDSITKEAASNSITSDTGEIERRPKLNQILLDSDKIQGVLGDTSTVTTTAAGSRFKSNRTNASMIITPLDNLPISQSKMILITALARVSSVSLNGKKHILTETLSGEIEFYSSVSGLQLARPNNEVSLESSPSNGKHKYRLALRNVDVSQGLVLTTAKEDL